MATLTIADLNNGKRDLQTVSEVANSRADTTVTRFGDNVLTLAGALRRLGYQAPVPYAPGLSVDSAVFTVSRDSVIYAPDPALVPFTTGAWNAAQWRVVQNTENSHQLYQFESEAAANAAAVVLPEGSPLIVDGVSQGHVTGGAYVAAQKVPPAVLESYADFATYNGPASRFQIVDDRIGGTFKVVPGDTTTPADGGVWFILADGRRVKRAVNGAIMIPWYTPGTANDTAAVQAAFDAGKAIRDGGAGYTYSIDGTITLQDGQNMLFSGAEFKQLGVQKPMFNAIGKKRIRASYGRFTGLLEPLYLNSPSSQAICFAIEGADDVSISDCEFENFLYSPVMSNAGANNVTFKDNRVRGPGPSYFTDVNMRGTSGFTLGGTNVVVSGNQITGTTQGGIITQGSANVAVSDNIIHDLVNEHGLYLDTGLSCVTVSGNVIRNTGEHGTGIKVQLYDSFGLDANSITITGNTVYSSGSTAISVTNTGPTIPRFTSGISVTGNAVYAAGQDAISLRYARGATVSGNSVYSCLRHGIELIACAQITAVGNTVVNSGLCGIFDSGCGDATYIGNTVVNPGTALAGRDNQVGIFVGQETEHFIADNVVRGTTNMSYGMFVAAGGATLTVIDNALSGGTNESLRLPGGPIRFFRPGPMSSALGTDAIYNLPSALQRGSMPGEFYGTAAPTTGAWQQRDRVHNLYPSAGGVMGWVCVAGGTPGTWKTFGSVAP